MRERLAAVLQQHGCENIVPKQLIINVHFRHLVR